jgi:hypothetical protein
VAIPEPIRLAGADDPPFYAVAGQDLRVSPDESQAITEHARGTFRGLGDVCMFHVKHPPDPAAAYSAALRTTPM